MAKPKGINQKAKWRAHSIRLARYADRVQSVYDTLNQEVAQIALRTNYDGSEPFKWNDYPATKKKFDEIRTQFVTDMRSVIYSGMSEEWKQSNLVQDLLADKALAFYGIKRNGKKARAYYQKNSDVLKAFQQRKDDGLNLSQKLWNQSADYKQEMEYCLSSAIEKGMSAVKLSKKLSKYLSDFPSLKKDYKEKYGKAVKCQDCEYRSIRLARSEINMAYRTAEQERWKQFDFVLGYEVKLTQNGRHVPDICDDLAGKYPKDFVFKGWHPNCYSADSEVLTNHGWKFFKDVRYDDRVLSLNPLTRNVEWVEIMDMQCYESEGKMIHFYNKTLDCLVTQEHKMVYLNKSNGEIRMRQAKDYTQGMGGFYRGCNYDANDVVSINIGGMVVPFDQFCEFMGYYLSDGSLQHNSGIIIAQKDGQPYKELMIDCVRRLGFEPKLSEEKITFYHAPLNRYLQQFGTAYNKFVPAEIRNASKRQIRIFMDAFIKCDGYVRNGNSFVGSHGNICIPKAKEKMYFTTSPQMSADLSELILKIGARPSFYVRKASVTQKKNGVIIKGNYDCWVISECKSVTSTVFEKEEIEYTGKVYDLSLTRNHIMYIRRNGKCFWGSNCMCYVIPILKTEEQFFNYEDASEVEKPPQGFSDWLEANAERIDDATERGTLPYWYTDNEKYVQKAVAEQNFDILSLPKELSVADRSRVSSLMNLIDEKMESAASYDKPNLRNSQLRVREVGEILSSEKVRRQIVDYYGNIDMFIDDIRDSLERGMNIDSQISAWKSCSDYVRPEFPKGRIPKLSRGSMLPNDMWKISEYLNSFESMEMFYVKTGFRSYEEFFESLGGIDKVAEKLSALAEESRVYMCMDASTLERKIIKGDGKFKNSLETGKGSFKTIGEERATKERIMFGLSEDADFDVMPKYGFMAGKETMDYEPIVGFGYGDTYVRFRDSAIRSRTTITCGDSYDGNKLLRNGNGYFQSTPAAALDKPDSNFALGILSHSSGGADALKKITEAVKLSDIQTSTYIEAQIYGALRIEDVDAIFVQSKKQLASLTKTLKKKGLDIEVLPCKYDTRLKLLEDSFGNYEGKAAKYALSLADADVDALGDFYIDGLCKRFADPKNSFWKRIDMPEEFMETMSNIASDGASSAEKRTWLKSYYSELRKKGAGKFPKVWWQDYSPSYGGWTSDVLNEELLKGSK